CRSTVDAARGAVDAGAGNAGADGRAPRARGGRRGPRAAAVGSGLRDAKLVTAGQLAAGIAHEVGTPLNVARGRAELTLSHLGKEHADAGNQQIVIDQIDRVTRLLQQLLDYVRPSPSVIVPIEL